MAQVLAEAKAEAVVFMPQQNAFIICLPQRRNVGKHSWTAEQKVVEQLPVFINARRHSVVPTDEYTIVLNIDIYLYVCICILKCFSACFFSVATKSDIRPIGNEQFAVPVAMTNS